jgi:hypothetical protein
MKAHKGMQNTRSNPEALKREDDEGFRIEKITTNNKKD